MPSKIKFIHGAFGSGKSYEVFRKILAELSDGRSPILIVPEQYVLSSEAALSELAEGLGTPTERLSVLSFRRLANLAFRRSGGLCYNYVDGVQSLILRRAVKEVAPSLRIYGVLSVGTTVGGSETSAADMNTIEALLGEVTRFSRANVTPETLAAVSEDLTATDSSLADKLHDLALIGQAYSAILHSNYDDPEDDLFRLADILRDDKTLFSEGNIYIDAFFDFTYPEYLVIEALLGRKRADGGEFALHVATARAEGDKREFLSKIITAEQKLRRLADKTGAEVSVELNLTKTRRAVVKDGEIAFLTTDGFTGKKFPRSGGASDLEIIACKNEHTEAVCAAKLICAHVAEGGRYGDISVALGDAQKYIPLCEEVFFDHKIPCFTSERRGILDTALFRHITSMLALAAYYFRNDDVLTHIKSGFALAAEQKSALAAYVALWKLEGARIASDELWNMPVGGFSANFREESESEADITQNELNAVNEYGKTALWAARIFRGLFVGGTGERNAPTVREVSAAVYNLCAEQKIADNLTAQADEIAPYDPSEAAVRRGLWKSFCDLLDEIVNAAGDERCTALEYKYMFEAAAKKKTIGAIPTALDCVTVGDARLMRVSGCKKMIVLGVMDGVFPRSADRSCALFSRAEINTLEKAGIEIMPSEDDLSFAETLSLFSLMCSASETAYLTYSTDKSRPSAEIARLIAQFGERIRREYENFPPERVLFGEAACMEAAATSVADANLTEAAARYFAIDPRYIKYNASPNSRKDAAVRGVDNPHMTLSPTRLERFLLCPFSYALRYTLKIKETGADAPQPNDIGTVIHAALESFVKSAKKTGYPTTFGETKVRVNEIFGAIEQKLFGAAVPSEQMILFSRMRTTAAAVAYDLAKGIAEDGFTPTLFEARFGKNDGGAIELSDGSFVSISGIADRIDTKDSEDGERLFRIIDYKTGDKEIKIDEVKAGFDAQLFTYLFTVENLPEDSAQRRALGAEGKKLTPQSITYYIAKRTSGDKNQATDFISEEEAAQTIEIKRKTKTFSQNGDDKKSVSFAELEQIKTELYSSIAYATERIKRGEASLTPLQDRVHNACKYCKYDAVCLAARRGDT